MVYNKTNNTCGTGALMLTKSLLFDAYSHNRTTLISLVRRRHTYEVFFCRGEWSQYLSIPYPNNTTGKLVVQRYCQIKNKVIIFLIWTLYWLADAGLIRCILWGILYIRSRMYSLQYPIPYRYVGFFIAIEFLLGLSELFGRDVHSSTSNYLKYLCSDLPSD